MPVTKKTAPKKRRAVLVKAVLETVPDLKKSAPVLEKVMPIITEAVKIQTKKISAWPVIWSIGGTMLIVVSSLAYYQLAFAGRIYPGVKVGDISLAGYNVDQAEEILRQAWNSYMETGVPLEVNKQNITLTNLVTSATDPDLSYELIKFDASAVAQTYYKAGRQGSWLAKLVAPVYISVVGYRMVQLPISLETDRIIQYIRDNVPNLETEPKEANLVVDLADNISVEPEVAGLVFDRVKLETDLVNQISTFASVPIKVDLREVTPTVTQFMVAQLIPQARALLTNQSVNFTYNNDSWEALPSVWHRWLGVHYNSVENRPELSFLSESADEFFLPIEASVNQPARDAKFEIREGRVVAFQGSWQGREINRQETLRNAFLNVTNSSLEPIVLVVTTTEPTVTTVETNELGISEIVGIGRSNFKGSPANRRHNIKVGAATLNGVLIKPQEEFSLLKTLGPIDGEHGYLQELVIKGNRTIPEYGGGLCQIGTTTFRAALSSGLPITARRNHSYRVVYYEPAGTDATIYDPAPDFKFINDTGNTILIQTRIEGDELIFEFWGRPDGRQIIQTKPRIFNIVAPAPTKIVETEDLEPGVKKCTEKPHSGADAEFSYTVTYPDGQQKAEVFKSHYVPWQEVCLVGVPKGTLTPIEEVANPEVLPTPDTSGQAGAVTQ